MKVSNFLLLDETDLTPRAGGLYAKSTDLKQPAFEALKRADLVIFISNKTSYTEIIKNRTGTAGVIDNNPRYLDVDEIKIIGLDIEPAETINTDHFVDPATPDCYPLFYVKCKRAIPRSNVYSSILTDGQNRFWLCDNNGNLEWDMHHGNPLTIMQKQQIRNLVSQFARGSKAL